MPVNASICEESQRELTDVERKIQKEIEKTEKIKSF